MKYSKRRRIFRLYWAIVLMLSIIIAGFASLLVVSVHDRTMQGLKSGHDLAASRLFQFEERIRSLAGQLELDDNLWNWLLKKEYTRLDMYQLNDVQRTLNNITVNNPAVVSVYLHSRMNSTVLSTNHMFSDIEAFPDRGIFYRFMESPAIEWVPARTELAGIGDHRMIASLLIDLHSLGIAALNIDLEYVLKPMLPQNFGILVYDAAGRLLYANTAPSTTEYLRRGDEAMARDGPDGSRRLPEHYIFDSGRGPNGLRFVTVIPVVLVSGAADGAIRLLVSVLLIFLAGASVAYPYIKKMLLQRTSLVVAKGSGELNELQDGFLIGLLNGDLDLASVHAKANEYGIEFYGNCVRTYVFQIDDYYNRLLDMDDKARYAMRKVVFDLIKDAWSGGLPCHIVRTDWDKIAILVTAKLEVLADDVEPQADKRCEDVKANIRETCGLTVCAGISERGEALEEVPECYRQSLHALQYKLIYGKDKIIWYKDIPSGNGQYRASDIAEIISFVRNEDRSGLIPSINRLFGSLVSNQTASFDVINAVLSNIVLGLAKLSLEWRYDLEEVFDEDPFLRLYTFDGYSDKRTYVQDLCGKLIDYRIQRRSLRHARTMSAIVQHIDENFDKYDISLTALATEFNLSPSYISTLINEELSMGLVEYVNELRITKSLGLLKQTNLPVQAIAVKCGFTPHTFIRNFKKAMQITPGEYRSQHVGGAT